MKCEQCEIEMLKCKPLLDDNGNRIFQVDLVKCPKCLHLKVLDNSYRAEMG